MRLLCVMTMNCVFSDMSAIFVDKAADVRVVERCVDLVEQTERRRAVFEDREDERDRRHRLFAAGKQQNVLQAFARRLGDDLDAGFENVVGFRAASSRRVPPPKSSWKNSMKFALIASNACLNRARERSLISRKASSADAMLSMMSCRCEVRNKRRSSASHKLFDGEHVDRTEILESRAKIVGLVRDIRRESKSSANIVGLDQFAERRVQVPASISR